MKGQGQTEQAGASGIQPSDMVSMLASLADVPEGMLMLEKK